MVWISFFIPSSRQAFVGVWRWIWISFRPSSRYLLWVWGFGVGFAFPSPRSLLVVFGVGFAFLFLISLSCRVLQSFSGSPSVFVDNDMLTNERLIDLELRIDLTFQTKSPVFTHLSPSPNLSHLTLIVTTSFWLCVSSCLIFGKWLTCPEQFSHWSLP